VLVVDDEQSVAEFMRELLRSWGLEVDVAHGAEEALSMLESDPGAYDLVITDQTMPRMSGLQLAERIARLSRAAPVVLYTGTAADISRHELEAACVKELVLKPVEPFELRSIVARYIPADPLGG
jgi:CheY-like chemotaxis protein